MSDRKIRIKDAESGQWKKVWPKSDKAKPAPGNKAKGAAPENKGAR